MPGSFTDHFLARLLQKQDLRREDVTLIDRQGQDALDALINCDIDGWLAIDPWLTRAIDTAGVVVRAVVGDEIINRSLFWTRASWQQRNPEAADWVVGQLRANDIWIAQYPIAAAHILTEKLNPAIQPDEWLKTIKGRPWGIMPTDDMLLTEQQQQADDLFDVGFIPAALSVNPRRYA